MASQPVTDPIQIATGERVGGGGNAHGASPVSEADADGMPIQAVEFDPSNDPPEGFPFTASDLGRMVEESYHRLEPFRQKRLEIIKAYVGPHYPGGQQGDDYDNLVQQAIEMFLPSLTTTAVEAEAEPATLDLQVEAMAQARKIEATAKAIDVPATHAEAVLDALLSPFGIVWVGLKAGSDQTAVDSQDRRFNAGSFIAASVDLDDFVMDQAAKKRKQTMFNGHRTRTMRKEAMQAVMADGTPLYNHEVIENATRISTGDVDRGQAQELAGRDADPYQVADMIELWYIAVYFEGGIWCCVLDQMGSAARFARAPWRWWGPQHLGPYLFLSFLEVPNNAVPLAYANRVLDLHNARKKVTRKAVNDFIEAKDVNIYREGEQDLADAVRTAEHGSFIKGDPTAITTVSTSGSLDKLFPVIEYIKGLSNDATGGSQLQAGAKDGSKTATGASILAGRQEKRENFMQQRSGMLLSQIADAMKWYIFNDPYLKGTVIQRLPGGDKVELVLDAEMRESEWSEASLKVNMVPAQNVDPLVKGNQLIELCKTFPLLTQLGPQAFAKIMTIMANRFREPMLDEINPDPTVFQAHQQELMMAMQAGPPGRLRPPPGLQGMAGAVGPGGQTSDQAVGLGARRPGAMALGATRSAMTGGGAGTTRM